MVVQSKIKRSKEVGKKLNQVQESGPLCLLYCLMLRNVAMAAAGLQLIVNGSLFMYYYVFFFSFSFFKVTAVKVALFSFT